MAGLGTRRCRQRSLTQQPAPCLLSISAEGTEHQEDIEPLEGICHNEEYGEGQTGARHSESAKHPGKAKEEGEASYDHHQPHCPAQLPVSRLTQCVFDQDNGDDGEDDAVEQDDRKDGC